MRRGDHVRPPTPPEPKRPHPVVNPEWQMPEAPRCSACGTACVPEAIDTGDGWCLDWGPGCDDLEADEHIGTCIPWPFGNEDFANGRDLEALGFVVV